MNRTAFVTALAILLVMVLALATWMFANVLLVAFAGLLLAVLFRHSASALAYHASLPVGAAMMAVFSGFIIITALLIVVAGPRIANELVEVVESLPGALDAVRDFVADTTWGGYLLDSLSTDKEGTSWNVIGMLGGTVKTVLGAVANLVVLLTVAAFLSINPDLYRRGFIHLVPKDKRARTRKVLDTLGNGLWRWLLGQSIDMVVVAVMTGLGLWLIGVPVPVALALIAGLTNFIPYLGPFLGGIPATLIAFSQSPTDALYTAGLFLLVQQLEGNVLMPMIQRQATALPPALTVLAVIGLGGLFGIGGALLATPLLLVVIILVRMLFVEEVLEDDVEQGP